MRARLLLLVGLLALGVVLEYAGVLDRARLHGLLETVAGRWWTPAALVAAMTAAYALALPGSALILPTALLFSPVPAAAIIAVGGALGAIAAYPLARHLGASWADDAAASPVFRLLQRNSDLFTLCGLRVLPGFPHSAINYGAGLLRVSPAVVLVSAAFGLAVKGYLYASAVQKMIHADEPGGLARLETVWPLLGLAALFAVGWGVRRWRTQRECGRRQG